MPSETAAVRVKRMVYSADLNFVIVKVWFEMVETCGIPLGIPFIYIGRILPADNLEIDNH